MFIDTSHGITIKTSTAAVSLKGGHQFDTIYIWRGVWAIKLSSQQPWSNKMCATLELHWYGKGSCRSSSFNLIGSPCHKTNHRFFCKHWTKHPRTAHYWTYAPCTHIQGSRPFDEGFLTTTVSLGTSACTRQRFYWALMPPFPVQFPSWHYWWTVCFPSRSPAWGRFNNLTPTVWLHLPPSLNFLPAQTNPIRERWLILVRQDPHLQRAQWLLIPANGIIQWALEHCKDANTAAWPRGRFRPLVLFILPLSDVQYHREEGM